MSYKIIEQNSCAKPCPTFCPCSLFPLLFSLTLMIIPKSFLHRPSLDDSHPPPCPPPTPLGHPFFPHPNTNPLPALLVPPHIICTQLMGTCGGHKRVSTPMRRLWDTNLSSDPPLDNAIIGKSVFHHVQSQPDLRPKNICIVKKWNYSMGEHDENLSGLHKLG